MSLIKDLNLLVVPARVIELMVSQGTPLNQLQNFDSMSDILTPEDLLFYSAVNQDIKEVVPEPILKAFGYNDPVPDADIWTQQPPVKEPVLSVPETLLSKCGIYMSTNAMFKDGGHLYHLAHCNKTSREQHSYAPNANNYVAQFFEISPTTIGVCLTIAEVPTIAKREAVEGLMALLYDDYLSNAEIVNTSNKARTPLTRAERNSYCLRELSESGLISYYSEILMNN